MSLDKETIAQLNEEQLVAIAGGQTETTTCRGGANLEEAATTINTCNACSCNDYVA